MITVKSKMQRPVTFQQTLVFGFSHSNKTLIVPLAMIVEHLFLNYVTKLFSIIYISKLCMATCMYGKNILPQSTIAFILPMKVNYICSLFSISKTTEQH